MRPGNIIATTVLAVVTGGLAARAVVALSHDRPTRPAVTANSSTIEVIGFSFPETVTIKVGGTLTWRNQDGAAHTVTFAESPTPTPAELSLEPGGSATTTFTGVGTYQYRCEIHPSMTGRIEVVNPTPEADPYATETDPPDDGGYK